MIVQNIKSGRKFDATKEEFDKITQDGNAYKYKLIEDDAPLEVKSLRSKIAEDKSVISKPKK